MNKKYKNLMSKLLASTLILLSFSIVSSAQAQTDRQQLVDTVNKLLQEPEVLRSLSISASRGGSVLNVPESSLPSPFIIGGTNAPRSRYPEYALVLILNSRFEVVGACGGTMISRNKVLTAGHCSQEPASSYAVVPSFYSFNDTLTINDLFFVSRVRDHPNYNPQTLSNDVGIMTLERSFFGQLAPVLSGSDRLTGEQGTVIGTGLISTNPDDVADVLQEVPAPITTNAACNAAWDRIANIRPIESSMMCAGFSTDGRGTCSGDSGGALFVEIDGQRIVAGSVSFGIGECELNRATQAYARMTSLTDFIRSEAPSTTFVESNQAVSLAPIINLLLDED